MVRVRMGQDHDVEATAAASAEDGQEDALADVDRTADEAAAVDEHRATVGQIDEASRRPGRRRAS